MQTMIHQGVFAGFRFEVFVEPEGLEPSAQGYAPEVVAEDIEKLRAEGLHGWFQAEVRVTRNSHSAHAYVGACSYASFDAFLADGYVADMLVEALYDWASAS